jgi:hypothetical protein
MELRKDCCGTFSDIPIDLLKSNFVKMSITKDGLGLRFMLHVVSSLILERSYSSILLLHASVHLI